MTLWLHIHRIFSTAVINCFLVVSFACSAALAAEPKRVMLLHSFGPGVKPWSDYARAIREELSRQSLWPLDLREHSLVTARFGDEDPEVPFVSYLSAVFAKHPLDLIVSIGAPAAAFIQRHRQQLFPTTPMVLTVVDQRRVQYSALTVNDTVVAVSINYLLAFENILQVLPDTKTVAVVVGNSPIEKYWKEEIGHEVKPLTNRIALTWYNDLSFEDILKRAAALPPQSAIFWELMVVDAAGVSHEEGSALTRLHAVANAPIFTYTDAFFGREVVGGPQIPVLEAGRKTAEVAVRILGGETASDIKIPPVGFGTPKFDWREMQRWGISESRLPPASEIHFRSPTIWDQYRWHIMFVAAIILVQTALILGLMYEHRRRTIAEADSLRRANELARVNRIATIGELSASLAHEINQPLAAIVASGSAGLRWLARQTPDVDEVRTSLQLVIKEGNRASAIVDKVRAMFRKDSGRRTPVDVNRLVLDTLSLTRDKIQAHNVSVETALFESSNLWVSADQVQLQQLIFNLIVNAIEAMSSEPCSHTLRIASGLDDNDSVLITVEDSGPGIAPENLDKIFDAFFTTKPDGMGMGLAICRSIVEAHGGRLWASGGSASRGCIFHVVVPRSMP